MKGKAMRGKRVQSFGARRRAFSRADRERLTDYLRKRQAAYVGLDPLPVVIDFDQNVPVGCVTDVLDSCHKAAILDLRFASPELCF